MEDFIFTPEKTKPELSEEFYTLSGCEDFFDKQNQPRKKEFCSETYAKKIIRDDGSVRYSVRFDTNGKLFNPISMYENKQNQTFLDRVCRSSEKFKNVSYKVFDLYVNFLRTKNIAWLNNAEREAS